MSSCDICVITTIHPPFDGRIYERSVVSLSQAGFRIFIIAPWREDKNLGDNIQLVSTSLPKRRIGRPLHAFKSFLKAMRIDAKTYHFHDIDFIFWAIVLKLAKRVPVVYDCHENYPEEVLYGKKWIPKAFRLPISIVLRAWENMSAVILKDVIVVVPNLQVRFGRMGCNVQLIRNFSSWKPMTELAHGKNVVCTGSLSEEYGAYVLLDIAREIKKRGVDTTLIVAERFSDPTLKAVYNHAIEQELLPIIIHPKVTPKNIGQILSKASVALSVEQDTLNMRLGYHAKLFEYMAFGLPIIASDITSNALIINESASGVLVQPDSATSYVDNIEVLLQDTAMRDKLRANGFKAVSEQFSWDAEKKNLVGYFKLLIARRQDVDHK